MQDDLLTLDEVALVGAAFAAADDITDANERDRVYATLGEVLERFASAALKEATRAELEADDYLDFLNSLTSRAALRPLAQAFAA